MKRIAIIGSGGSGKSTLARKMGDKLNLEVWYLDRLLWKPNWQLTTREEQREIQNELIAKDRWIIDGNYTRTLDIRLNAGDTIVFLDISKVICVTRVLKRMIRFRNRTRPDMREGCNEKIDFSFIKWVWGFPKTQRPYILTKLEQLSTNKEIIVLKSPKEVQRFLDNL